MKEKDMTLVLEIRKGKEKWAKNTFDADKKNRESERECIRPSVLFSLFLQQDEVSENARGDWRKETREPEGIIWT